MYVSAIVLAAGLGMRMKSNTAKPLLEINRKPIIVYSLEILSRHPQIKDIILVVNAKSLKNILSLLKRYRIKKIKAVVLGGKLRQDSVLKGLAQVDSCADLVLIHDAARPFFTSSMVTSVISEAQKSGAAILGVPVKATIKQAAGRRPQAAGIVKKTLKRENLWEAQTPQVFKKDLIIEAYNKYGRNKVTDDASLVEKLGEKINIVAGSYKNIKITTPEDLVVAEAIIKKCNTE
ncbi:MAG: 2-C-methyl-D-erythritol 4-phosphate cytidylyltransferase [Omnitrophica WOR_2 bacterium RBG_13_41_10]|nr:MAG: 2-C-methyl-D-erythritol 4-phosphate cytidylyltransferase [Omnitrophica WOR_2 bacterium RBG_13_41_10]